MSTMCDGAASMSDEDETLVLNYLDDDLDKPGSPSGLVDENQNTSVNTENAAARGLKPRGRGRPKGSKNKTKSLGVGKTRKSNKQKATTTAKDPPNGQSNPSNIVDIEFKIENFDDGLEGLTGRNAGFGANIEDIGELPDVAPGTFNLIVLCQLSVSQRKKRSLI